MITNPIPANPMTGTSTNNLQQQSTGAASEDAQSHKKDPALLKIAQDFESIFLSYMIKTMRATVPKSELSGESSMGKDLFTGMFDQEVSTLASRGRGTGMADMIYEQLVRRQQEQLPDMSAMRNMSQVDMQLPAPHSPYSGISPSPVIKPPSTQRNSDPIERYGRIIDSAARHYDVDPALIRSIIAQESGGRSDATSPKGAKGVMQLMDATAKEMGVRDIYNPEHNILGGVRYMRKMLDRYNGDIELALAAYNAGPSVVDRYGGIPPYQETQRYVNRVLRMYQNNTSQGD